MAFITNYLFLDFVLVLIPILYFLYLYFTSTFNYWKDRGVPFVKPVIFFGNLKDQILGKRSMMDTFNDIYKQFEGERFGGFFELSTPSLLVRDPALIERILIKDFSHFHDRALSALDEREPLTVNLANIEGQQWRNLRYKLTPTFTSGKLKSMFEQICNCGQEVLNEIELYSVKGEAVDVKYLMNLFTIDVIASCAFGLQFKPNTEDGIRFRKAVEKVFYPSRWQMARMFFVMIHKNLAKSLGIRVMDRSVTDYFMNISKATVKHREESKLSRNDFLQLMLTLRDQEKSGKEINLATEVSEEDAVINQLEYTAEDKQTLKGTQVFTDDCIAAQSFVFLAAGSETSSGSLTFVMYALATNPEVQTRVQQEVDNVIANHNNWNYQALKEMTYLDQVIQETMRLFPLAVVLTRKCSIPYKLPGTDIVLEKGARLSIPVSGLHTDPRFYPEPDVFNPDRFKGNNHRPTILPRPYLPFGDGPRICIAMRFAVLEMKICVARIMSEYSVTLSDKTQTPLRWDPSSFLPRATGGIWVKFQKRSKISEKGL